MKNQIKKITVWIAIFGLCVWVSMKFIDWSSAANIACPSEATLKGDICVCKDTKKLFQWGVCVIDPTNICPPDSKQVGANCVCNDKTTFYDGVMCVTKPDLQCTQNRGEYKNWRCDFTKAIFGSAPVLVTAAPIIPTPDKKLLAPVVKILDIVKLPSEVMPSSAISNNTNEQTMDSKLQNNNFLGQIAKEEEKIVKFIENTNASNQVWYQINRDIDSIWTYIKK